LNGTPHSPQKQDYAVFFSGAITFPYDWFPAALSILCYFYHNINQNASQALQWAH
jgi:hypothetical protein